MLYTVIKQIFRFIFSTIYPWKVKGLENIPEEGPLIICSNHISWADPALVASMVTRKQVFFMAKEELFNYFILGNIIKRVGAFPVKRDSADLRTIKKSLSLLKDKSFIGLFPEGTRSRTGQIGEALPGVALIALKSKAPVLPVAIKGKYRLLRRSCLVVGAPLTFAGYYDQKARGELLTEISRAIMDEIRRLHAEV